MEFCKLIPFLVTLTDKILSHLFWKLILIITLISTVTEYSMLSTALLTQSRSLTSSILLYPVVIDK